MNTNIFAFVQKDSIKFENQNFYTFIFYAKPCHEFAIGPEQ